MFVAQPYTDRNNNDILQGDNFPCFSAEHTHYGYLQELPWQEYWKSIYLNDQSMPVIFMNISQMQI